MCYLQFLLSDIDMLSLVSNASLILDYSLIIFQLVRVLELLGRSMAYYMANYNIRSGLQYTTTIHS
jgi:hypothetical protein